MAAKTQPKTPYKPSSPTYAPTSPKHPTYKYYPPPEYYAEDPKYEIEKDCTFCFNTQKFLEEQMPDVLNNVGQTNKICYLVARISKTILFDIPLRYHETPKHDETFTPNNTTFEDPLDYDFPTRYIHERFLKSVSENFNTLNNYIRICPKTPLRIVPPDEPRSHTSAYDEFGFERTTPTVLFYILVQRGLHRPFVPRRITPSMSEKEVANANTTSMNEQGDKVEFILDHLDNNPFYLNDYKFFSSTSSHIVCKIIDIHYILICWKDCEKEKDDAVWFTKETKKGDEIVTENFNILFDDIFITDNTIMCLKKKTIFLFKIEGDKKSCVLNREVECSQIVTEIACNDRYFACVAGDEANNKKIYYGEHAPNSKVKGIDDTYNDIPSIAFDPVGDFLFYTVIDSEEYIVQKLNLKDGTISSPYKCNFTLPIYALAVSKTYVAAAAETLCIWLKNTVKGGSGGAAASSKAEFTLVNEFAVTAVSISDDEQYIVRSYKKRIEVWEIKSQQCIRQISIKDGSISAVSISDIHIKAVINNVGNKSKSRVAVWQRKSVQINNWRCFFKHFSYNNTQMLGLTWMLQIIGDQTCSHVVCMYALCAKTTESNFAEIMNTRSYNDDTVNPEGKINDRNGVVKWRYRLYCLDINRGMDYKPLESLNFHYQTDMQASGLWDGICLQFAIRAIHLCLQYCDKLYGGNAIRLLLWYADNIFVNKFNKGIVNNKYALYPLLGYKNAIEKVHQKTQRLLAFSSDSEEDSEEESEEDSEKESEEVLYEDINEVILTLFKKDLKKIKFSILPEGDGEIIITGLTPEYKAERRMTRIINGFLIWQGEWTLSNMRKRIEGYEQTRASAIFFDDKEGYKLHTLDFRGATGFNIQEFSQCIIDQQEKETDDGITWKAGCWIKKIRAILIPEDVDTIPTKCFYNLPNLEFFIGLKNVNHINNYAFTLCPNLVVIDDMRSAVTIGFGVFRECNKLRFIQVPWIFKKQKKLFRVFKGKVFYLAPAEGAGAKPTPKKRSKRSRSEQGDSPIGQPLIKRGFIEGSIDIQAAADETPAAAAAAADSPPPAREGRGGGESKMSPTRRQFRVLFRF